MNLNRPKIFGGLLGATVVAGGIIVYNSGATPALSGEITAVRTLGMDKANSVAIVNIRAVNSSNYDVSVGRREMEVVDAQGNRLMGKIISVFDIRQLFRYYPALGGMKDEPMVDRQEIPPGESVRALAAARFAIPKHELDLRRELIFHTVDYRGRKTTLRQVSE